MKSYSFLFWAYNVIWGGLALYLLLLMTRLRQMGRRLDSMEQEIARRDAVQSTSRDS